MSDHLTQMTCSFKTFMFKNEKQASTKKRFRTLLGPEAFCFVLSDLRLRDR